MTEYWRHQDGLVAFNVPDAFPETASERFERLSAALREHQHTCGGCEDARLSALSGGDRDTECPEGYELRMGASRAWAEIGKES